MKPFVPSERLRIAWSSYQVFARRVPVSRPPMLPVFAVLTMTVFSGQPMTVSPSSIVISSALSSTICVPLAILSAAEVCSERLRKVCAGPLAAQRNPEEVCVSTTRDWPLDPDVIIENVLTPVPAGRSPFAEKVFFQTTLPPAPVSA